MTNEQEATFWIIDDPEEESKTNPEWVALVSERAGGVVAVGRRDIIVSLADLLQTVEE